MADALNEFWKALVDGYGDLQVDVGSRWRHLIDSNHPHPPPEEDATGARHQTASHADDQRAAKMWEFKRLETHPTSDVKFEPKGFTFEVLVRQWDTLAKERDTRDSPPVLRHTLRSRISYDPQSFGRFAGETGATFVAVTGI